MRSNWWEASSANKNNQKRELNDEEGSQRIEEPRNRLFWSIFMVDREITLHPLTCGNCHKDKQLAQRIRSSHQFHVHRWTASRTQTNLCLAEEFTSPVQSSHDSKKLVKAVISPVKCLLVQLLRRWHDTGQSLSEGLTDPSTLITQELHCLEKQWLPFPPVCCWEIMLA